MVFGNFSAPGTNTGGSIFGQQQQQPPAQQSQPATTGLFGQTTGTTAPLGAQPTIPNIGATNSAGVTNLGGGVFAQTGTGTNATTGTGTTGGGLFGSNTNTNTGGGLFGNAAANTNTNTGGLFGNNAASGTGGATGGLFGSTTTNTTNTGTGGLFGSTAGQTQQQGGGLFGNASTTNTNTGTGGLFGQNTQQQQQQPQQQNTGGGLFGNAQTTTGGTGGLFGNAATNTNTNTGGLFGAKPAGTGLFGSTTTGGGGLFGSTAQTGTSTGGGLFGNQQQQQQQQGSGGLFGSTAAPAGGLFGSTNQQQQQGFGNKSTLGMSALGGSTLPPTPQNQMEVYTAKIEAIYNAWNPQSPQCRFQHPFYNNVSPGEIPHYTRPANALNDSVWERAVNENPDPKIFTPVIAIGFDDLRGRVDGQAALAEAHTKLISDLRQRLEALSTLHNTKNTSRLQRAQTLQTQIMHKLLRLIQHLHFLIPSVRSSAIGREDEALRSKLEEIEEEVRRGRMKGKLNELWAVLGAVAASVERRRQGSDSEWAVVDEDGMAQIVQVLKDQQTALAHLTSILKKDQRDMAIVMGQANADDSQYLEKEELWNSTAALRASALR